MEQQQYTETSILIIGIQLELRSNISSSFNFSLCRLLVHPLSLADKNSTRLAFCTSFLSFHLAEQVNEMLFVADGEAVEKCDK